jgi:hypothetical protein
LRRPAREVTGFGTGMVALSRQESIRWLQARWGICIDEQG